MPIQHPHPHFAFADGGYRGIAVVAAAVEQHERVAHGQAQHARYVFAGLRRQRHFGADGQRQIDMDADGAHGVNCSRYLTACSMPAAATVTK